MKGSTFYRFLLTALALCAFGFSLYALSVKPINQSKTVTQQNGVPTKTTNVSKGVSDTIVVGLLGLGAVLMFCAAFYNRVGQISIFGQTVALNPVVDTEAVAAAVTKIMQERYGQTAVTDSEGLIELAARTAAATYAAVGEARAVRYKAISDPKGTAKDLPAEVVEQARQGLPLPQSIIDQMAQRAVERVSRNRERSRARGEDLW